MRIGNTGSTDKLEVTVSHPRVYGKALLIARERSHPLRGLGLVFH